MNCQHFGVCGGCSLPGVPYAEQLARKQASGGLLPSGLRRASTSRRVMASPSRIRFSQKVAFVFGLARRRPRHGPLRAGSRNGSFRSRSVLCTACAATASRSRCAIDWRARILARARNPSARDRPDHGNDREASRCSWSRATTRRCERPCARCWRQPTARRLLHQHQRQPGPFMVGERRSCIDGPVTSGRDGGVVVPDFADGVLSDQRWRGRSSCGSSLEPLGSSRPGAGPFQRQRTVCPAARGAALASSRSKRTARPSRTPRPTSG